MSNEELLRGIVAYTCSVQNAGLWNPDGTTPGLIQLRGSELLDDPCDDAMIDAIMERHREGLARLARR